MPTPCMCGDSGCPLCGPAQGADHEPEVVLVLCPGLVVSSGDGQEHFVTAKQLADCYGVSIRECRINYGWPPRRHYGENAIFLEPRWSGDYSFARQWLKAERVKAENARWKRSPWISETEPER